MKKKLCSLILVFLLLVGCGNPDKGVSPPAPKPGETAPSSLPEQGAQPPLAVEPTETFYQADYGSRWSEDGRHLLVRQGDTLLFVGLDNRVERQVSYPLPSAGPEVELHYSWSDSRMLVTCSEAEPGSETRVVEQDGRLTLTNAAIYTLDGELLREFPPPKKALGEEELEPYESSLRQCVKEATWLDEEHLAINLQAKVYLYSISENRLELVHDMTQAVREGYTVFAANSFGAISVNWGWDGVYYYLACPQVPPGHTPRYSLYAADLEQGARPLLEGITEGESLVMRGGRLLSLRLSPAPQDPASLGLFEVEARVADLPSPAYRPLVRYESLDTNPQWDGTHFIYDTVDLDAVPHSRTFHILRVDTGAERTFCPGDLDAGEQSGESTYYQLLAALPGENGYRYFYSRTDVEELEEDGGVSLRSKNHFYLYDEDSGENRLLKGQNINWGMAGDEPVSPGGTHYVDGLEQVRVLPIGF